jgi:hypothetical protein
LDDLKALAQSSTGHPGIYAFLSGAIRDLSTDHISIQNMQTKLAAYRHRTETICREIEVYAHTMQQEHKKLSEIQKFHTSLPRTSSLPSVACEKDEKYTIDLSTL